MPKELHDDGWKQGRNRAGNVTAVQLQGHVQQLVPKGIILSSQPLNVEPQVEETTAGKRVRGPSRGKEVQGIVDRYGKLNVPIPSEFRAPVGDYASKLASKIGVEVRTRVPDPSVRTWKYVDDSVKGAIVQRLNDQFDLEGDPIDIEKAMNTKFGRRLSNHTYKLHKQFRELKDAKGEDGTLQNFWVNPVAILLETKAALLQIVIIASKFEVCIRVLWGAGKVGGACFPA
ncbi:hypothetical protein MRB53_032208 [Persea americana]|uniref:Uncharacterized protein n=1 Tax=Persea americana TaxID=3435 RepID=A0ACC2KRZ9_PERAE|nr:hypothetical protein MRB53_032208 [Persea americana]